MYINMYQQLEDQIKNGNSHYEPKSLMANSTFVHSQNIIKGDDDVYDRLKDRAAMTFSMDPSMFQHNLQAKPQVKPLYKKKNSVHSDIDLLKTEESVSAPLAFQATEKKLKTLRDLKGGNNSE